MFVMSNCSVHDDPVNSVLKYAPGLMVVALLVPTFQLYGENVTLPVPLTSALFTDDDGTVAVAVPDFVPSCTLVAVMVTVCALAVVAGAVHTPPVVIEPAEADHVTDCDGLLVPATVAVNVCVPPPATVTLDGDTVTPVTVDVLDAVYVMLDGFVRLPLFVTATEYDPADAAVAVNVAVGEALLIWTLAGVNVRPVTGVGVTVMVPVIAPFAPTV
jgi:hypothetical protein